MVSGMDWGSHAGISTTAPDRAAFDPASLYPETPAKGVEAGDVRQDFNEQRLIYKCLLDPSVDNSGYAGVIRVVRNGGSARMDGDTLVIENASSVMLLTRIEYFPDFSDDKVEALRQAVEGNHPGLCGTAGSAPQGPVGNSQPRHRGFRRRLAIRHVDGGTSGRSAVEAGLLARVAGEGLRNGTPLVHPQQRQVSEHRSRGQLPPSTCKRRVPCRATCGKAWRPTSTGWRAWPRIAGPTPRTSSDFAALRIPSFQTRVSASISITPAAPESESGPTGFPPEAGACASSGITTWSPETWNFSAIAWCRPIKNWRCSTRIS